MRGSKFTQVQSLVLTILFKLLGLLRAVIKFLVRRVMGIYGTRKRVDYSTGNVTQTQKVNQID